MDIRAAEISTILKDQIENFGADAEVTEVGKVLSVGDGIARVYGLDNVQAGEAFNDIMKEKQVDAIDLKRVEVQLDWMNSGNSPEEKSEEK